MAQYKLIQDIEAEDKILGPLTLRQFIFALVAAFFGYLSFIVVAKGVPFLLALFLPPMLFCAFFAVPFGRDQPTEIWFLAKLRFWFLPRQRVWNQSGVKELVTITVPKKVERVLTNGLTETEVKSRLQALANTIDSRGWAIKNVDFQQPTVMAGDPDRLIDLNSMPVEVPADDLSGADDILDTTNNPIAQQFQSMITQSAQAHRQKLVEQINMPLPASGQAQPNNWFVRTEPTTPTRPMAPDIPAAYVANEDALSKQLKRSANSQDAAYGHMRTVRPLGSQPIAPIIPVVPAAPMPTVAQASAHDDPAIRDLASNNDLNVETLARLINKKPSNNSNNEVVISLH